MAVSEAQKRANKRYVRANVKAVNLKFYPPEHDLYEWLGKQDAKSTYIKRLIREDMERHCNHNQ